MRSRAFEINWACSLISLLLLFVRGAAAISEPGMMSSFLSVGIDEDMVQGRIALTKWERFAWDCFRWFL